MMTSPSDEQRRYSGDLISASLYASPVLGVKGNRFIIDSLQDRGMRLDSKHRYSLSEIVVSRRGIWHELCSRFFRDAKVRLACENRALLNHLTGPTLANRARMNKAIFQYKTYLALGLVV